MRKFSTNNLIKWEVHHICITIYQSSITKVASATNVLGSYEDFLQQLFAYLKSIGYVSRNAGNAEYSPYSESEYYTFLKWDDNNRIKIVLDVRWAQHPQKQWGQYTTHDRHIHYMKTQLIPDIIDETGSQDSTPDAIFHDVYEDKIQNNDVIFVDDTMCNNYKEAFRIIKSIIDAISC